eukprot:91152-Hanusia_phi.AAC.4
MSALGRCNKGVSRQMQYGGSTGPFPTELMPPSSLSHTPSALRDFSTGALVNRPPPSLCPFRNTSTSLLYNHPSLRYCLRKRNREEEETWREKKAERCDSARKYDMSCRTLRDILQPEELSKGGECVLSDAEADGRTRTAGA